MTGPPRRNDPCPCGSGRRFKHCCGRPGSAATTRAEGRKISPFLELPDRVLAVPGFLDPEECRRLVELADSLKSEDAAVTRHEAGALITSRSDYRITTTIKTFDQPDTFLPLIARALREHVEPGYQRRVEWFEWPDVLLYRAGGRYDLHTDADLRDKGTGVWHRVMDRDFSVLIYLNDDFAGGQLAFPRRGETIRPETGMLVAFPSDHRFAHAALPVTGGRRYVIVTWAAVLGSPRVHERRRLQVVYPDRRTLPSNLPLRHIEGAGYVIMPRNQDPS
ncbi:MAG: 2OG-Fe(II) oxygenase [Gammaproteobacteria bacterium]|jgi:predicted 2-oxoglutarate/Fe(II)-dependent dioxygenase YbiX